ncbi:hypothetical protein MKW98_023858, partial [Papaver atlanticum]
NLKFYQCSKVSGNGGNQYYQNVGLRRGSLISKSKLLWRNLRIDKRARFSSSIGLLIQQE